MLESKKTVRLYFSNKPNYFVLIPVVKTKFIYDSNQLLGLLFKSSITFTNSISTSWRRIFYWIVPSRIKEAERTGIYTPEFRSQFNFTHSQCSKKLCCFTIENKPSCICKNDLAFWTISVIMGCWSRSPSLSKRGASTSSLLSVENDAENEVKREQVKQYEKAWPF